MCLSKIYTGKENKDNIIEDEASNIIVNNGIIEIYSVFGEVKKLEGYYVKEINFTKNYTILEKSL